MVWSAAGLVSRWCKDPDLSFAVQHMALNLKALEFSFRRSAFRQPLVLEGGLGKLNQ